MLKSIVNGAEHDIISIPMNGRNLWNPNSMTTNERGEARPGVELPAGKYCITNLSTVACYWRIGVETTACNQINPNIPYVYINAQDTLVVWVTGSGDKKIMINSGSTALPYEPYGYQNGWEIRDNQNRIIWGREDELQTTTGTLMFKGYDLPIKVKSLLGNSVQNGTPSPDNPIIPEFCGVRTENLIDESKATPNAYISSNGAIGSSTVSNVTDYIDINTSPFVISGVRTTDLMNTGSRGICFFNANKEFIGGVSYSPDVMSNPFLASQPSSNAKYIRFTYDKAFENGIMLNSGSTVLPYEPYGWKIPLDNYEENLISLPTITTESDGLTVSSSSESMTLFGNITRIYEDNPIWKQFDFTLDAGEYTLSLGEPRTYQNGYAPRLHKYDDGSVLSGYLINPVTFTLTEKTHVYMAFYIDDKQLYNDRWMFRLRNGSTVNEDKSIYLGEVPTIRRIKKLVLTGNEVYQNYSYDGTNGVRILNMLVINYRRADGLCNICQVSTVAGVFHCLWIGSGGGDPHLYFISILSDMGLSDASEFKTWVAQQYTNGTPVTIWYVLSEPQTGIVNEPLAKIGDHADELTEISVHNLSAPLYGIGDYKDILNLSTGVVTRKIKKLVLTGEEASWVAGTSSVYILNLPDVLNGSRITSCLCSHYNSVPNIEGNYSSLSDDCCSVRYNQLKIWFRDISIGGIDNFKSFLQQQYQAGTPVTVWYVLVTPETETVTVPTGMTGEIEGYLTQISTPTPEHPSIPKWNGKEETGGTYAVTVYTPPEIQTVSGKNTITVRTEIPPSDFTIKAHARETGITEVHYGFKINKSVENSNDAVSYMYDAVTMTPAYMDYDNDEFNYGSWENAFFVKDCYPVALNLNGTEAYKLDPNDYTKKLNGEQSDIQFTLVTEEPSDWSTQWKQYYTKDSNNNYNINDQESEPTFTPNTYYKLVYNESFTGNFMMAFPKVWFYRHEDSSYNYVEISNCKLSDDWRCYAHVNRYGEEVDYIYLPLFKGVIKDSKLRSLPGQIPHGSSTAMEEVAAASALGNRWQLWDHSSMECINDLLILMSKSIDSQTAFGNGVDKPIDFDNTYTYGKLQTGTLVKSGKFKGFSSTVKDIKVFGMEGLWSNRFDRMQGMLLVDNVWKIKMTPPYNFSGTDFLPLSNAEVPDGSGYISRVQTSEYGSIPASILNGSQDVFYKDYFFKNASGTCVAIHGGYCRNGSPCGFRCIGVNFDANSGPSWATDGVGASPVYK